MEVVAAQRGRWEVFQVEGDDQACAAMDRSRHHVAIVGIWKLDGVYQVLKVRHQAAPHMRIHELSRPPQLFGIQIWAACQDVACPFVVDLVAPPSTKEI